MISKKLPKINFIGNKEKIASWICSKFPKKKLTVFDAFSGGASISYESKKNGFKLIVDVIFEDVAKKCEYISPVPGGVGPMTIASLLMNTFKSANENRN